MAAEEIALVIQANLAADLLVRGAVSPSVAGAALVQTTDTNGNAVITVGSAVAGQDYAFIRIIQNPSIRTDSLGLAQRSYAPSIIQLVLEASTVGNNANASQAFTDLLDAVKKWGTKVETYLSAHGTVPVVGSITGTPTATWYPDVYNPLRAQT